MMTTQHSFTGKFPYGSIYDVSPNETADILISRLPQLRSMGVKKIRFDQNRDLYRIFLNELITNKTNPLISQHWFPVKPNDDVTAVDLINNLIKGTSSQLYYHLPYAYIHLTDQEIHDLMEQDPSSWFPYLRFGLSSLYIDSRRAKTTMDQFVQGIQISLNPMTKGLLYSGDIAKINDTTFAVSVTRYGFGMSRGQFGKEPTTGKEYCGTFYYLELESDIILTFNSYLVYPTKIVAAIDLTEELIGRPISLADIQEWYSVTSDKYEMTEEQYEQLKDKLPLPLRLIGGVIEAFEKMTLSNLNTYLINPTMGIDLSIYSGEDISAEAAFVLIDLFKRFARGEPVFQFESMTPSGSVKFDYPDFMYALEDPLDQPLCLAGRSMNVDILIFTHMAGRGGPVEEILDTRDRSVSFQSLHRVIG